MKNNSQGISIILPAYNEEKNIKKVVVEALAYLRKIKDPWEIIIVNDGSTDQTGDLTRAIEKKVKKVRVINHKSNLGYGISLKEGFLASLYDYVFFTDTDRQFDLKALEVMWPLARTGVVDLVIGYRVNRKDPVLRKLLSRGYNFLIDMIFGLDVKDIDCAFKIFKKEIFKKIKIESNHFFVNTEILVKARFFKFKILEVGVPHFPRQAGKSSISFKYIPLTVGELIRIKKEIDSLGEK